MKRLLFTIPDHIARELQELIPEGKRSSFVVRSIQIPLEELKRNKKKQKPPSLYKPSFLRGLKKAEMQAKKGKVYTHEEIMKEFGLL